MSLKSEKESNSENTLKRADVVRKLHHATGMSSPESAGLMNSMFEKIADALIRGEDVKLAGFGTFRLREKAARLGRNPKTGEECVIAPRKVVTFKPSVAMKERVESALSVADTDKKSQNSTPNSHAPSVGASNVSRKSNKALRVVNRKQWIALFELLGSFAFADKCLKKNKAEAFVQAVLEIKASIDPKAAVTKKSVSSWVMLNQNRWATWKDNDALIPRFKANLSILSTISHKPDIIFAMAAIAIAENDYTDFEKSLIAHAILAWDMPANVISDLEYVCPDIIPDLQEID